MAAAKRGDYATAVREWRPLAEQGDARAQANLGLMYADGHGVERDDAEAVRWYLLAAEQGYAVGQFNLGFMYASGLGVPEDQPRGVSLYRRAAEQGMKAAQFNLAAHYFEGEGVERDFDEAYFWYALAARRGESQAERPRDVLAELIGPERVAALEERVGSWRRREAADPAEVLGAPREPPKTPEPAEATEQVVAVPVPATEPPTKPPVADEGARVLAVRTSSHADFDRVVLDLDRPTQVSRAALEEAGALEVRVRAQPMQPGQQHQTLWDSRMGAVEITSSQDGVRISSAARPRVIRVFTLDAPARVVIDLGAPGVASLDVPPDAVAVPPAPAPPEP